MVFTPAHLVKAGVGRLRRPGFESRAAVELARFGLPFFPTTRYALAASAVMTLVNEIIINRRRKAVEFGGGLSTLYMAKAMATAGEDGVVVTVESDAGWLAHVNRMAATAGVADRIRAVHAPLKPMADGAVWYDEALVLDAVGEGIDLVVVDGPVGAGKGRGEARRPAAGVLKSRLAPSCAVVLDDIHRPSHARIAEDWGRLLGMNFVEHHARGGFAYAVRGPAFDPIP